MFLVVGDAGRGGRLVSDGMVHGFDRVIHEFAGAGHLAIGAGFGLFHADCLDFAVFAQHFGRCGVEVHVVFTVGGVAFVVDVAVVFHVFGHLANCEQFFDHLTGQFVLAGDFDGFVVQIEVVLVDDELHARQLFHLA